MVSSRLWPVIQIAAVCSGLIILSACAAIPADRGVADVNAMVADRSATAAAGLKRDRQQVNKSVDELIDQRLAQPLAVDDAVSVALLRNPRLARGYARLGIAEADLYDAARISNPTFSVSVLDSNESGASDLVTYGLTQPFLDVLMLSTRKRFARGEVQRIRLAVAAEMLDLVREVETAYYDYAGERQVARLRGLVANAANLSARLAERFYKAGNINRQELRIEQAAWSEASIAASRAAVDAQAKRNHLNRLMGLSAEQNDWQLQGSLPLPTEQEDDLPALIDMALHKRLDLKAMQQEVVLLEDALGVTRSYRFVGDVEVGLEYERETDRSRLFGPTLAFQLPLFNRGRGRVLRSQSQLEDSRARLRELEIGISNQVDLAGRQVALHRGVFERHRDYLVPQREEIVEQTQKLQNYMIVGQFELLRTRQDAYDAYQGYIESLRDYWLARVELAHAVGGDLPGGPQAGSKQLDIESLAAPVPASHSNHKGMKGMNHGEHQSSGRSEPTREEPAQKPMHNHGDTP